MKMEADKLKSMTVAGTAMKVVVLGIGRGVSEDELTNISSAPVSKNVIRVQDFSSLSNVTEQLRNVSCIGQ